MRSVIFALIVLASSSTSTHAGGVEDKKVVEEATRAFSNRDYQESLSLLLPLAERGDPYQEFTVAIYYASGVQLESEPDTDDYRNSRSVFWLRRAAAKGHLEAIELFEKHLP